MTKKTIYFMIYLVGIIFIATAYPNIKNNIEKPKLIIFKEKKTRSGCSLYISEHSNKNKTGFPIVSEPVLVWHTYIGGQKGDISSDLILDESQNIYVVGYSESTWGNPIRHFSGDPFVTDGYIAKFDSNGNLIWNTFLGSDGPDDIYAITSDENGFIYVGGYSSHTNWGNSIRQPTSEWGDDAFIAKLTPDGSLLWNSYLGGSGKDILYILRTGPDGSIYASGRSGMDWGNPIKPFAGPNDTYIAKLNKDGDLISHFFWGSENRYGTSISGMIFDKDGNICITGYGLRVSSNNSSQISIQGSNFQIDNIFVAKYDTNGNPFWKKEFGSIGNFDMGYGIGVDSNNNIYIAGTSDLAWGNPLQGPTLATSAQPVALKINSDGSYIWHTFPISEAIYSTDAWGGTSDHTGAFYLVGEIHNEWGSLGYISRLNEEGTRLWHIYIGPQPGAAGYGPRLLDLKINENGDIYVIGDLFYYYDEYPDYFGNPIAYPSASTEGLLAKLEQPKADLEIYVDLETTSPAKGEILTASYFIKNNGPGHTTVVRVKTKPLKHLSYLSNNTENGFYDSDTNTWRIGKLNNGESATLNISYNVIDFGSAIYSVKILNHKCFDLIRDNDSTEIPITIYEIPVLPPNDFNLERKTNNLLIYDEYFNHLTWKANDANQTTINKYIIFVKKKGELNSAYATLIELDANTYTYNHRYLKKEDYFEYKLVAENTEGRHSRPVLVSNS